MLHGKAVLDHVLAIAFVEEGLVDFGGDEGLLGHDVLAELISAVVDVELVLLADGVERGRSDMGLKRV